LHCHAHAGGGGRVLVEQLYEYKYWGPTSSNPITDPNPRLEAYIAAARRGAAVRLLLDSAFNDVNDPRGNSATCAYVNALAASEQINIQCLIGNPTGTGSRRSPDPSERTPGRVRSAMSVSRLGP